MTEFGIFRNYKRSDGPTEERLVRVVKMSDEDRALSYAKRVVSDLNAERNAEERRFIRFSVAKLTKKHRDERERVEQLQRFNTAAEDLLAGAEYYGRSKYDAPTLASAVKRFIGQFRRNLTPDDLHWNWDEIQVESEAKEHISRSTSSSMWGAKVTIRGELGAGQTEFVAYTTLSDPIRV